MTLAVDQDEKNAPQQERVSSWDNPGKKDQTLYSKIYAELFFR